MYIDLFMCCVCRLSALVKLVSEGLQMECCSEDERVNFGERLKTAIASFTVDFLPHMREEEEVGDWDGIERAEKNLIKRIIPTFSYEYILYIVFTIEMWML